MGISTFAHLLTDEEIALLTEVSVSDTVIKKFLRMLCNRPFFGQEEGQEETVSARDAIYEALKEASREGGAVGNHIRLEQKTKFWEATISGGQVHVAYGKKGTKGQTNVYSGGDAREYFDKKVKEKTRGGYKPAQNPLKALLKEMEERRGGEGEEGAEKRRKGGVLHRADFDKCGELLCHVVARAKEGKGSKALKGEPEMFGHLWQSKSVGEDVCYGPVYVVDATQVRQAHAWIAKLAPQDLEQVFDKGGFPDVLGALCDISKERDMEYCLIHFATLQALLQEATDNNCGLLLHFW